VLRDQEREPSPDFMAKLRNRIYRRKTTSDAAYFSWRLPGLVLLEMVNLLAYLFKTIGTKKDSQI
jgi:hypothetical protein